MAETASAPAGRQRALQEWQRLLLRESHVLGHVPAVIFQEAANQPEGTAPATAALDRLRSGRETRPWLRRLNKPAQGSGLLMTVPTGMDIVGAGAFSPDSSKIAAGSWSSPYKLTVWDASNGREISSLALEGEVKGCAFSPGGDRVVVAVRGPWGEFHAAKVVECATGNIVALLPADSESWQGRSCAFSPDGTCVAIGSDTHVETLSIFDASTGRLTAELALGNTEGVGYVPACSFSGDGRFVAAASPHGVKAWDTSTFKEQLAAEAINDESHTPAHPRALSFSFDSRRLLVAYSNGVVRIWDAETWNEVATLGGKGEAYSAAISADGRLVACEVKNTLSLWDLQAGSDPVRIGPGTPHAFAADGRLLSSFQGSVNVWRVTSEAATSPGHAGLITSCGFSPDGTFLVTASEDETLRVWEAPSGKQIAVLAGHRAKAGAFEFSKDGRRLLSRADDGVITWQLPNGALLATLMPGSGLMARGSALAPDGARAAVVGSDRGVRLVNAMTGETLVELGAHSDNTRDSVDSCRFLAGGRRLLSVGSLGTYRLWDAETGAFVLSLAAPAEKSLHWAATADGERFVAQWTHDSVRLWDGFSGAEIATITLPGTLKDLAFSPDSRTLATALYDHTIRLWCAVTGEATASLAGNNDRGFVFSPDGRRLLTTTYLDPATLDVWDVATAAKISSFGRETWGRGFSPDGAIVMSTCAEWLKLWDAETGAMIACQRFVGGPPAVSQSPDGSVVALGDWSGELYLLHLEGWGASFDSTPGRS